MVNSGYVSMHRELTWLIEQQSNKHSHVLKYYYLSSLGWRKETEALNLRVSEVHLNILT